MRQGIGGGDGVSARAALIEAHAIHASLVRPVLLAGAEPPVVVLEVSTAFALVFGVGFHVATLLLAVVYVTLVHTVMVWVAMQDPMMTMLYIRSLRARDFYAPHSAMLDASPRMTVSIPRGA